jgi:hypothetical protein
MKRYILPIILIASLLLSACDKVDGPYIKESSEVSETFDFPKRTDFVKRVLIEEFTGHRCVNCPMGHAEVKSIMAANNHKVVAVAVHAGFFAGTQSSVFTTDFTTEVGEKLYAKFGTPSVPSAVVNRKDGVKPRDEWASAVTSGLGITQDIDLQIHKVIKDDKLTVYVQAEALTDGDKNVKVGVYITESKIIAPQKNGSATISDYEHNHVLRKGITDYEGVTYWNNETVTKGTLKQKAFKVDIKPEWNVNNLHIVAFAVNSSGEIIQAEEI